MAMLTESRRDDGLCMDASIFENIALAAAPRYAHPPLGALRFGALRAAVNTIRQSVRLTETADNRQPVRTLSGGNQQKAVLAKWLLNQPTVFILDEPTRGIDVGAKYEIYSLIDRLAARGTSALVISSEIEELIGISDRILVMSQGEIIDQLTRDAFDPQRIMTSSLRAHLGNGGEA
jgi:ribose transport system ATP-binding protein